MPVAEKKKHPDPFFQQLNELTNPDSITDERLNPFGKKFSELTLAEKEHVLRELDPHSPIADPGAANRARHKATVSRAKKKREAGHGTVILLGKFNGKTEKLINEKAKELGYKYPASLINHAIEDLLGLERGSSFPESFKNFPK